MSSATMFLRGFSQKTGVAIHGHNLFFAKLRFARVAEVIDPYNKL